MERGGLDLAYEVETSPMLLLKVELEKKKGKSNKTREKKYEEGGEN